MEKNPISTALRAGIAAALALLAMYFAIVSLVSGWGFARSQFSQFWYFVITLAAGFGAQIGLYSYLKKMLRHGDASRGMVAVTGTTSTAAMVSCCTHYLVNILPILGATGIATIASQYQVQFFWVGIAFNIFGIVFIARRIFNVSHTLQP